MQQLDRNYILLGLCWVVVGMGLGIWLGITNQQNYANSHAHVGLLGFVASTLFGLLHWAYPALAKSRLALWQFIIYEIGVVILVIGKFLIDGGKETVLLPIGALITIAGAALMLVMFAKHGHKAAA
jgi:peptidoglycan/LPS O-acetylase OafA/YrhL